MASPLVLSSYHSVNSWPNYLERLRLLNRISHHYRTLLALISICLIAPALTPQTPAPQPATFQLSGHIIGSSGKNPVYIALWQADGFLERPAQTFRITPGADPVFHFQVAAGRWALSAFEDRNGNGVLDMALFWPKEPSGFWRAFTGRHKPRFDELAVQIERDTANADITLK